MEQGYIEPCGCTDMDRDDRRHELPLCLLPGTPQEGLAGWCADVGGLASGFGREAEIKFRTLVESKEKMGYAAVGFGADDLRLPPPNWSPWRPRSTTSRACSCRPTSGCSASIRKSRRPAASSRPAGCKIGVTAILGKQYQKQFVNSEVETCDPDVVLERLCRELKL